MIEEGLTRFFLDSAQRVKELNAKVFPLRLPQRPIYPAITYSLVSAEHIRSLRGPSGLANPHFQFDCWGKTYFEAKQLAKALRLDLDGFRGFMGVEGTVSALLLGEWDVDEDEVEAFRVVQRYSLWHKEETQ